MSLLPLGLYKVCWDSADHTLHMATIDGADAITDLGAIEMGVDVSDRRLIEVDPCDVVTGWAAVGDNTSGVAVSLIHITGTKSILFDKLDTGANTYGGIAKTVTSVDLSEFKGQGVINCYLYVSATTNIVSLNVRLGTDATNYNQWTVLVGELAAGWNVISVPLGSLDTIAGNGWNDAAVTYAAVLVNIPAATALAGIILDSVSVQSAKAVSVQVQTSGQTKLEDSAGAVINPAKEDGNLATVKTNTDKIPAKGTAIMTGATPVTISTDDTVLTPITNSNQILSFARIDTQLTGGTAVEIVAGTAAKKIYVIEMYLSVDGQCEIEVAEAGAATVNAPPFYYAARGGIALARSPGYRFCTDAVAEGLDLDEVAGLTVNLRGYLWYYKV